MDENLNTAAVTEDTTPQTETVEGADTPSVPENVDNPTTEPQTDTTPEADGGEENPQPPVEPFLTAKFNHKDVDLTREQTLAYAPTESHSAPPSGREAGLVMYSKPHR